MTRRISIRDDGRPATPLGIMVAAAGGGLATIPLRANPNGYFAILDGITYHLTATVTGRTDDA